MLNSTTGQRIRQIFNEATQTNMGGPNQWGGAKFNAVVRGNSQQADNLKSAVEALQGPGTWANFQKTLDVFEAMGRRQAPGSMTEPNRQIAKELQKGTPVGEIAATIASPSKMMGKAQELYDNWRYGKNTAELAAALTRPDAAKVFAKIAHMGPSSTQARNMASAYLLNTAAQQAGKRKAE
ncbi:hypothetical protein [Lichenihabitans psoromatis]|uniref:hypothetical protein n=1 Tax=Lichenihabitans psoromatis TaxID=2528642 RepID=UPI001035FC69|nr:hypothetical protein [Lichenihabitans psoromatis]